MHSKAATVVFQVYPLRVARMELTQLTGLGPISLTTDASSSTCSLKIRLYIWSLVSPHAITETPFFML